MWQVYRFRQIWWWLKTSRPKRNKSRLKRVSTTEKHQQSVNIKKKYVLCLEPAKKKPYGDIQWAFKEAFVCEDARYTDFLVLLKKTAKCRENAYYWNMIQVFPESKKKKVSNFKIHFNILCLVRLLLKLKEGVIFPKTWHFCFFFHLWKILQKFLQKFSLEFLVWQTVRQTRQTKQANLKKSSEKYLI